MILPIIEERIRHEYQLPDDFRFWKWECFPKGSSETIYVQFSGGQCPLFEKGPRKGKPNYRKAFGEREFYIPVSLGDLWERDYEQSTGKCKECQGSGQTVASINFKDGITEYKTRKHCAGSGKPKATGDKETK